MMDVAVAILGVKGCQLIEPGDPFLGVGVKGKAQRAQRTEGGGGQAATVPSVPLFSAPATKT